MTRSPRSEVGILHMTTVSSDQFERERLGRLKAERERDILAGHLRLEREQEDNVVALRTCMVCGKGPVTASVCDRCCE